MSDKNFVIDLFINAYNNSKAGFEDARRDAEKFTDGLKHNEDQIKKNEASQRDLTDSLKETNDVLVETEKNIKKLRDTRGTTSQLSEDDANAILTYRKAAEERHRFLASGEEDDALRLASEQKYAEARVELQKSVERRILNTSTEFHREQIRILRAEAGEKNTADKAEAKALEEKILRETKSIKQLQVIKDKLKKIEEEALKIEKEKTKAEAERYRASETNALLRRRQIKQDGEMISNREFLTREGVQGPQFSVTREGQDPKLTRKRIEEFTGAVNTRQDTIRTTEPAALKDKGSVGEIGQMILGLKRLSSYRKEQIDDLERQIKATTVNNQEQLKSELDLVAAGEDLVAIQNEIVRLTDESARTEESSAKERKRRQAETRRFGEAYANLLRQNAEEERRRAQEMADFVERTQALKADSEELGVNLRSEREKRFELEERRRAQRMADDAEKRLALEDASQKLGVDLRSEREKQFYEEKIKLEEEQLSASENAYKKAQQLRAREDRFITDKRRLLINKGGEEPAPELKAKLVVDREEIMLLKEELRVELRDLEAKVKIDADPLSVAKIEAIKAILGKDIDVNVSVDTTSFKELLSGGWEAFAQGAQKASKSISSFDNVFRGLLVLGIVAFLGQLATGAILAASALTALVSSALSAAGALGGALVAGIGQALPAVGVLAAFGNRLQNVFGALKQSNLEQQQASYSGAKAADTQAKSLSGVADAQKALTEARKTAKKTLEDLIFAEKGQALSAEEAGFALQKAISSGGSMGVARAQLGVESANRDLAGTRSDISSRKKSGIEGSPEVAAAQKSLDQALQSANQGTASVGAAAGKLNYLVDNLSKSEQRLLKALIRLQTAWRKFAESITAPLTNSFTFAVNKVVKILDSKQIINAGKRLSEALGSSFTQIFDALFSKQYVNRFLALGEELAKNLKPVTNIVINLLNIFQNFAEAGSPALSLILGYLDDIIGSLDRWSSSIAGKKSLTDFFTEGSGSLKGILDLLMSIGNVILAIMGPAGGIKAGNTIIDQMTGALNKFAQAIKDPSSRVGIFFKNFFDQGKKLLPTLGPVFSALGTLVEALISPRAIKAFENFADIVAKSVIPALNNFIKSSTFVFNAFSYLAKSSIGEFIIKWGIAGALIFGVGSKLKAVASPFIALAGYLKTATGNLTLFNRALAITESLTGIPLSSAPIGAKRKAAAAKKAAEEAAVIGYGQAGGLIGPATPMAAAAAARAARIAAKEKGYGVAGGLIGPATEAAANASKGGGLISKVTTKLPMLGKLGGLLGIGAAAGGGEAAAGGGLAASFSNPFTAAIAVIVVAIVGLIAYAGRLKDVWNSIKDTFTGVLDVIKKSFQDLKNGIQDAFDGQGGQGKKDKQEFLKVLKDIGNFLADVLIPIIKILGVIVGTVLGTAIRFITATLRAVIKIGMGIYNFVAGIIKTVVAMLTGGNITEGVNQMVRGILGFFEGIGGFIIDLLLAPFEAAGDAIKLIFEDVIKFFADGIDSILDTINKIPYVEIQKLNYKTTAQKEQEKRAAAEKNSPMSRAQQKAQKEAEALDPNFKGSAIPDSYFKNQQKKADKLAADKKDKSPAKPKAATKADSKDATAFLNTFDPQTVQLSNEIVKKLSRYWHVLRKAAKDSINDVIDFLKDLRGAKGNGRIDKFVTSAISDFKRLRTGVRVNMTGVTNIIENQMQNSMKAVHDAALYMKKTLNDALKAVGADGDLIKLSVGAPPKVTGNGKAVGGWVGNRGERGEDAIPTILGRGEAVLNWGHQKVVEPALRQVYGFGLDEMFGRTRSAHAGTGRATGGFARGGRAGSGRGGRDVVATVFGSEGDFYDPYDAQDSNTAAGKGYRGDNMRAIQWVFGEIGDSALGHLARGYKLKVSRAGKSAILGKYDINDGTGAGSRAMDIWIHAARYLNNFQKVGMGTVHIEPVSQSTPLGPTDGSGGGDAATLKMPKITGGQSPMGKLVTKGTKKMMDGAQKYLDKKAPVIDVPAGGGDLNVPAGATGKIAQGIALAKSMGLTISSFNEGFSGDGVHTPSSWHYKSRAIDVAGSASQMAAFFKAALKRFGKNILELFYDPLGAIKNGSSIPPVGDHSDHVHLALARGGRANMSSAYERRRIELARREKRAAQRMSGLKKYANGGMVDGQDGQAVPIVAHAGEWVVNKMQQAKLAAMAGTTPDRVKGALGFGGGPTHFKDGGVIERNPSGSIRTVNKNGSLNVLELPELNIQSYFTSFQSAFDKAFKFIDRQIKTLSSSSRIERQIKAAEKRIERLKKGDESDKQQKVIDKLEERVKTLNEKLLKKDIDTLLKSIRKLTAEDGVFSQLAQKITTQFDRATTAAQLAAAGLTKIGTKLKKLTTGAAFEKAINPEEIANKEAALQALLSERLQSLRTDWVRTLSRVNSIIKKTKLAKTEKITKTLAGLNADVQSIQRKIDKAEEGDESEAEKKRIERLKKSLKAKKEQIKNQENNLKKRRELDAEVIQAEDKIAEIEKQIIDAETAKLEALKTAFEEGTKAVTKSQDAALKQAAFVKSAGEIISSFGGSILGRTGQELITKSLADNKKAAIEKREALKDRLAEAKKLAASDPRFQSLVDDLSDQLNESILAVLQATADEGANAIAVLQKGVEDKIKAIDVAAALENVNKSIGELIGNNGMVSNALNASLESAKKRQSALAAALAEAEAQDQSDPRWKELTDSLRQQLADAGLSIYEANAAIIQNAIDATDKVFQRGEFIRGISERGAALAERMGNRSGAFATRQGNLAGKGADLQSQRDSLQALLSSPELVGNTKQLEELQNKIAELDMSIAENTQETKDLSLEYRKSQVDLITGKSDRTTGLLGSVGGIIANIAKATGSSQSLESQIGLAQQIKTALGLEQGGLADQISKAIADQQLGSEANAVLTQLQTAFSSGDPASFAATLAALSPTISELESTLGVTAAGTFQTLINAMISNTTATTDNTANLAELNGLANQPQQFATTAWTKFRTALFNGVGDILPQFQIPQMATGGAITKGGLFQLHPGEFVVNATQSNLPSDSPINITVNEANKPLDVTALASRIAFEKRTRR